MDEKINEIMQLLNTINHNLTKPDWGFWNVIILAITCIIIVIYTCYTYGILVENKKMRSANFMPFIYFSHNDFNLALQPNNQTFQGYMSLINIGRGPAMHIEVEDIEVGYFILNFKHIKNIIPHQSEFSMVTASFERIIPSGKDKKSEFSRNPSKLVKIKCKDLLGNKYIFKYDISNLDVSPKYIGYEN